MWAVIDNNGKPRPIYGDYEALSALANIHRHHDMKMDEISESMTEQGCYRFDERPRDMCRRIQAAVYRMEPGQSHMDFLNYQLDGIDREYVKDAQENRLALKSPLQGDWLLLADGSRRRIAHDYSDGTAQPTAKDALGSFFLGRAGWGSHSGALDSSVTLEPTNLHPEPAPFWFFRHGSAAAHNSVQCMLRVKTWQEVRA